MIIGIFLVLVGVGLFIAGGVKMDDSPGIERSHLIIMMTGLALLIVGGIFIYGSVLAG